MGFELAAGEVLTVVGPNGAGKSTLLRAISGPSGQVGGRFAGPVAGRPAGRVAGRFGGQVAVRGRVAHVLEGRRVFATLTVEENLRAGGFRLRRLGRAAVAERVTWAMSRFPMLAARSGVSAGRLSGGEQQLLAIATGLVCAPDVLLLDEPCVGLAADAIALVAAIVAETGAATVVAEPYATLFPSSPVLALGPTSASSPRAERP